MKQKTTLVLILLCLISFDLFASPSTAYKKAQECYTSLNSKSKIKRWNACIAKFEFVKKNFSDSNEAIKAKFSIARLYQEKHEKFSFLDDLENAIKGYNEFIKGHKNHFLADDALYRIGLLRYERFQDEVKSKKAFEALIRLFPNGDMVPAAKDYLKKINGKKYSRKTQENSQLNFELLKIDHSNNKQGMLVSLYFNSLPEYTSHALKADRANGKPERIVIDLSRTYPKKMETTLKIGSLIRQIRLGLQSDQTTRVVLDLNSMRGYEVVPEKNKLLVKVYKKNSSVEKSQLQAKFPYRSIIIDPGHGGKDPGAIGQYGTKEKQVSLQVSKKLAYLLRKKLGVNVYLTRTKDRFLSLDQRADYVLSKKGDLFISVHANASESKSVSGVQTFYLNNASSKAAQRLAARENEVFGKTLSVEDKILTKMLQNANTEESRDLAHIIQKNLLKHLSKGYTQVKDLKVHSALFYVLAGTKVPGILIETSFITNPKEEKRLKDSGYQWALAEGIVNGVEKFGNRQSVIATNL